MSTPQGAGTGQAPAIPTYLQDNVTLATRIDVNRDKPRYLFSIGDHIERNDKPGFRSLGAYMGGVWIGPSEVEGAPCMKRTHYMIYRGGIIPLETTAIGKKADHRERDKRDEQYLTGTGVPDGTRGYQVYAGDSLNFLQSDRFRPMGIVELRGIQYLSWTQSQAASLQTRMFPEWNNWLQGIGRIPTRLDDWMALLLRAFEQDDELRDLFSEDIAESHQLFIRYARQHIERNRQQIMSKRNVDMGGFFVDWNGRSRLYADQLGMALEAADELRPAQGVQATGDSALIEAFRQERELRREEMRAQREQMTQLTQVILAAVAGQGGNPMIEQLVRNFSGGSSSPEPEEERLTEPVNEIDLEEAELAEAQAAVGFGQDPASVQLTEIVQHEEIDNPDRQELLNRLEDPSFGMAVQEDEGLRGSLRENPSLADLVDEHD